jgi:hypothetical protein
MIQIPLTQITSEADFAEEVTTYIAALKKQQMGKPGMPAPSASQFATLVVARQPQSGPVATRGPDDFVVLPYSIVDDRPVSPEIQALRDSILN